MKGKVPGFAIWLVLLMCGGLYLMGNGRVALWDRDEPRYAMASRWMAQSGDWVVPRVGWGEKPESPRTAKPAGIYWLQAGVMKALGETVFAARLPSTVATTVLLILLTGVISRHVGKARAFWTILVLGTTAMLVVASKMCVTDTVLLLWITIAQICLLAIYRGKRDLWVAVLMWAAIGLGGLIKGPVVLGVFGTTMLVLAVFDWMELRQGRECVSAGRVIGWWKDTRVVMGVLILMAVCGPWLYLVQHREPTFLTKAVSHDVIERMKTGLEEHKGWVGYYLATIFGTFFPWSLLLPLTFIIAWKRKRRLAEVRFALAAIIGPWILMELVRTKLPHYVLPIFPPMAYLMSDAILRCLRGRHDGLVSKTARVGVGVWAAVVGVFGCLPWLVVKYYRPIPVAGMAVMTGVVLVYSIGIFAAFVKKKPAAGLVGMGVGFGVFCAVVFGWVVPNAEFLRLSPRVAEKLVAEGARTRGDVVMTGYKEQSLAWYQGGTIDEVWANYLSEHDVKDWPTWWVLTPQVLQQTPAEKVAMLEKVAAYRGLNYASGKWMDVWVMRKKAAGH